ncbi:MAG: immunoglobulin domain-containing protein [Planctomycetota bacterium]
MSANRVAHWDGHTWAPLGEGVGGSAYAEVRALAVFDPDDDGPRAPSLIVGGRFTAAGQLNVSNVASWDGASWSALGSGVTGVLSAEVRALAVFDEDAQGPLPPQLVAGGTFSHAAAIPVNGIAKWDGQAWHSLTSGVQGHWYQAGVSALAAHCELGAGQATPALFAAGLFGVSGGHPARRIARWGIPVPYFWRQPTSMSVASGGSAEFAVETGGAAPRVFRWYKDGIALSDNARISGSMTEMLTIRPVVPDDAGAYEIKVTNDCGSLLSHGAVLTVWQRGDLNCDGVVDFGDINPFVLALTNPVRYATQFPNCDIMNGDINNDGVVGFADINPFVRLLTQP